MIDPASDHHVCGRIRRVKGGFIVDGVNQGGISAGQTHIVHSFEDLLNLIFSEAAISPDEWRPGERVLVTLPAAQREKT